MQRLTTSNALLKNRAGNQRRGAAAVEFAVVLPLLMLLLLGGADFGRCFQTSISITNAARAGAEYGSMHPFDSSAQGPWQTGVQQAAVDELSNSTLFDVSKLTVTVTGITEGDGSRRVSVQATYPFKTIFNWGYVPTSITIQDTAVMRVIR